MKGKSVNLLQLVFVIVDLDLGLKRILFTGKKIILDSDLMSNVTA